MTSSPFRRPAVLTPLALTAVCVTLTACGSSSAGSTSNSAASSSTAGSSSSSTASAGPARGGRFVALRACLAKEGINLPPRASGPRRPPGGATGPAGGPGFLGGRGAGGGLRPPAGVSAQRFQAALQKCGGPNLGAQRRNSPAFRAALLRFAACMRSHGVSLPPPNTSGSGPVFDTRGLNPAAPKFRAADTACAPDLRGRFRGGGPSPTA